MLADPEPLRNLRHPVAALGDLGHRITLELVAEISFPHRRLLSSNLGKKASTNLGAIQLESDGAITHPAHNACRKTKFSARLSLRPASRRYM
ncbi:hypothetical protein GCM10011371_25260 [Novosphingobium marinum]|jgi:hypothetical protein|nr:hypothetical protein GCM10011371_25260 [Novosphingobium marinum]